MHLFGCEDDDIFEVSIVGTKKILMLLKVFLLVIYQKQNYLRLTKNPSNLQFQSSASTVELKVILIKKYCGNDVLWYFCNPKIIVRSVIFYIKILGWVPKVCTLMPPKRMNSM